MLRGRPRQVVETVTCNGGLEMLQTALHKKRQPVVLKSLDIGPCVDKWTWDYLKKMCGSRKIKVHVSSTPQMDFLNKNFVYRSLPFDEFIDRISCEEQTSYFLSKDEKYYFRSLGDDPRNDIADIRKDFSELAPDVHFPEVFEADSFFSSVFRISSRGVQLWTHYDVMDNMLLMVSGSKRVVLYEPKDALYMYLQDDKSRVLDIDNPDENIFPDFSRAIPYDCVLQPGDVLFIPAMWFHNVVNVDAGVAVNVFWRHLEANQYDRTDTYGNKDLVVAARAAQGVDRAVKLLDALPDEYRDFYARKLIARIQLKTCL
jgi:tRNA wybutosine-synthesizing protein 5